MINLHSVCQNRILAALPSDAFERIADNLELVAMPFGKVLCESGEPLHYGYFPTTSIFSLQYLIKNGSSIEIAGIGNEGMLGISNFLGSDSTPSRAFVRTAGHAYRIRAAHLKHEFDQNGKTMSLLLRYTQAFLTQSSQAVVCNRLHSIEQQLCRFLLLTIDRTASNELAVTQELIASMLGVRREGITEVAGRLQRMGLISYQRGHIKVIDRAGLEQRACECYEAGKKEFNRLMSPVLNDETIGASTIRPRSDPILDDETYQEVCDSIKSIGNSGQHSHQYNGARTSH